MISLGLDVVGGESVDFSNKKWELKSKYKKKIIKQK